MCFKFHSFNRFRSTTCQTQVAPELAMLCELKKNKILTLESNNDKKDIVFHKKIFIQKNYINVYFFNLQIFTFYF